MVGAAKTAAYAQAHAHSDILHVAATMGLIGLTAYALLGCSALLDCVEACGTEIPFAVARGLRSVVLLQPGHCVGVRGPRLDLQGCVVEEDRCSERCLPLALASVAVFLAVGRLTLADYHYARGGLAKSDPATSAMEFQRSEAQSLGDVLLLQASGLTRQAHPYMPLEQRRPLALAAEQLTAKAVERHR